MSFKNLEQAEKGILKGLVTGAVSTSEGIATGFVSGDLSCFTGHFKKINDAWDRLDGSQKSAVIELREFVGVDRYAKEIATVNNFVSLFVEWQIRKFIDKANRAYFDSLRGDFDEEEEQRHFNKNLAPKYRVRAEADLSEYL